MTKNCFNFATTLPPRHTAIARSRSLFTGSGSSKKVVAPAGSGSTTLLSRLVPVFYEPTHLLDYRLEMSRQNLIILMVIRILTHYPKIISDIVKRLS